LGMGAQGGGGAAGGRSGWVPLTGAAGGGGFGEPGGKGFPPGMTGMGATLPAGPGAGGSGGAGSTGGADPLKKAGLQRTEFIVLFIWKENTPSDGLMSKVDLPESTGTAAPGGQGGLGAPPGGMSR
jgi:hypothetical protein